MNNIQVQRTPEIIAVEINGIKEQTRTMFLCNSIEIGKRLVEAKSLLAHGEWGKWLESKVDYSQSTANNLMRLYEEYGSGQFSLFGDHQAKSQAISKLSYTQAVALLGIPDAEREGFIADNDVEHMSTRELQQAIKERDDALKAKEQAEDHYKTVSESYKKLEDVNHKHYEEANRLREELENVEKQLSEAKMSGNNAEIDRLQVLLNNAKADLEKSNFKIADLEKELAEKPIDVPAVVEKIPEEVEKELEELRNNKELSAAIQKFGVYFEVVTKGFNDLLGSLLAIQTHDQTNFEKYNGAIKALISRMSERL